MRSSGSQAFGDENERNFFDDEEEIALAPYSVSLATRPNGAASAMPLLAADTAGFDGGSASSATESNCKRTIDSSPRDDALKKHRVLTNADDKRRASDYPPGASSDVARKTSIDHGSTDWLQLLMSQGPFPRNQNMYQIQTGMNCSEEYQANYGIELFAHLFQHQQAEVAQTEAAPVGEFLDRHDQPHLDQLICQFQPAAMCAAHVAAQPAILERQRSNFDFSHEVPQPDQPAAECHQAIRRTFEAPNNYHISACQPDLPALLCQFHQQQAFDSPSRAGASMASAQPVLRKAHTASEHSQPKCADVPLAEEGDRPFTHSPIYPLGSDEDPNWLSEYHCFVRSDLVEVFQASHNDCTARNGSILYQQVGIRCRFCSHLAPSARASRSSAFPSSIRKVCQSLTMMLREHFGCCNALPQDTVAKLSRLKDEPGKGTSNSKHYWVYSARKIGMTDSPQGIFITEESRAAGRGASPFGALSDKSWTDDFEPSPALVLPSDRGLISEFLYLLLSQTRLIRLQEVERTGHKRSLKVGLPGIGCRYCSDLRRLGLCRIFPARRRTLSHKVSDIYDHIRRCSVTPSNVKEQLQILRHQLKVGSLADLGSEREFFDKLWARLYDEDDCSRRCATSSSSK